MPILKPDKEKDANKRPRVLLIPPPDLPVPAVQGGAVETLLTPLIRENEKQRRLDLLCASVPDEAARRAAEGLQHTKMLYVARPHGHRRYWPMVFLERCVGIAAPYFDDRSENAEAGKRFGFQSVLARGTRKCSSRWRWNCPRPMSSWLRAAT